MIWRPNVLVVAPTPRLAVYVLTWLTDAGGRVTIATSFADAKAHLENKPSVVISEVRLSAYNGLHLALRAQLRQIPAVILGDSDPVLQTEAEKLGARYLPRTVNREQLLEVVEPMMRADRPRDVAAPVIADNVCFFSSRDFVVPAGPRRGSAEPMHA